MNPRKDGKWVISSRVHYSIPILLILCWPLSFLFCSPSLNSLLFYPFRVKVKGFLGGNSREKSASGNNKEAKSTLNEKGLISGSDFGYLANRITSEDFRAIVRSLKVVPVKRAIWVDWIWSSLVWRGGAQKGWLILLYAVLICFHESLETHSFRRQSR